MSMSPLRSRAGTGKHRGTAHDPSRRSWTDPARRLFRSRQGVIGLIIVAGLFVTAVFGPTLAPQNPMRIDVLHKLQPPSRAHLLGTDGLGRDNLSRLLAGAPLTLGLSVGAVALGATIGAMVGITGGYFGGVADLMLFRLVDILLTLPDFLLALTIVAILGPGLINTMLAVAVFMIPQFARLARAAVIELRGQQYIEAAVAAGCGHIRVMRKHLMPNIVQPLIVFSSLRTATAILTISGLSFLGLGAQPPSPEWGAMIAAGREFIYIAPHAILFPGLAMMAAAYGFNTLGDGLRDSLDPRLRGG